MSTNIHEMKNSELIEEVIALQKKLSLKDELIDKLKSDKEKGHSKIRKKTESEEISQLVIESSPAVLFRWKAVEGWPVVYVSKNIEQFGYSQEELLSGKLSYSSIVHPEDLERVKSEVVRYSNDGRISFRQEYRIITKAGKVIWTDDRTKIERDADGTVTFYQGLVIDISERKRAELALWDSEQMLKLVFDNIPQRVFWKNEKLIYLGCNKNFAKDAGVEFPDLIVGKNDYELNWSNSADNYKADDIDVIKNGKTKINYEESQIREDGSVLWLNTTKLPLRDIDNNIIGVIGSYEDITEKKLFDQAIELSERRYRNFVDQTSDGFYMLATEHPIRLDTTINEQLTMCYDSFFIKECNDVFAKMYGYNNSLDIINVSLKELHGNWDIEKNIKSFRKFLSSGLKIINAETVEYDKKGVRKYFLNNYIGVVENELLIEIWGTQQDITYQREAKELLVESEKQYKLLFSNNPNPMFVFDSETLIFLDANLAAVSHYGYSRVEFLKMSIKQIRPEMDIPKLLEVLGKSSGGITHSRGYRHLKKNGEIINVDITSNPIEFNGRCATVVVVNDITQQIIFEEALKESEDKFRSVFSDSHDCIYVTSENGDIVNMNRAGLDLFGFEEEDVKNINVSDIYISLQEREEFQKNIDLRGFVKDYPIKLRKKSGKILDCLLTSSQRKDENGKIINYQGIIRDITEQKKSERELIKAKENAEKADKLKTEFLAQISHEIRTPINTLLNFSSLIKEETKSIHNDEINEYFEYQKRAGNRIIRTIDLVLNMSEVQAGSFQTNIKKLNVVAILDEIFKDYLTIAKDKELSITFSAEKNNLIIKGDEYSVHQIFSNLIDNSIKYTHKGNIDIKIQELKRKVVINIIDSGIGISKEYITQLFNPFSQEEQGYTRKYEGSGLGLSLVKKYVDINSAEISVESEKNVGTTFTVSFDLVG